MRNITIENILSFLMKKTHSYPNYIYHFAIIFMCNFKKVFLLYFIYLSFTIKNIFHHKITLYILI